MSEIKLVVFDIAGTTVRDSGQVLAAFLETLKKHQLEFTNTQLTSVRGSSKRQAILSFVPPGPDRARRAEEVYASFHENLSARFVSEGVEQIADAKRIFRGLRTQGIKVALNTGFDREITDLLLKTLKWQEGIVDAVVCGDDVRQGRPAPDLIFHAMEATETKSAKEVVNVGDTVLDLEAGHNAGVRWNIGVLSGAHDRRLLTEAPHTHILSSIAELPALFQLRGRKESVA